MKCAICGKEIEGYGNNPYPVRLDPEDYCCDECNEKYVIMARLVLTSIAKEKADELKEELNSADIAKLNHLFGFAD